MAGGVHLETSIDGDVRTTFVGRTHARYPYTPCYKANMASQTDDGGLTSPSTILII